mgnify:CR=1 FL=1
MSSVLLHQTSKDSEKKLTSIIICVVMLLKVVDVNKCMKLVTFFLNPLFTFVL